MMSETEQEETVLVTGASGVVGYAIRNICDEVKLPNERWVFLSSKDGNLADREEARIIFALYKPTAVIHLAARCGGLYRSMNENLSSFLENTKINETVLACAHEFKVKKVVSCMSAASFPDKVTYPIKEEMLHNGEPHKALMGYAYSKRMLDVLSQLYHQQYGSNFICVIPCNVYGPGDNFSLKEGNVISALMHRCYLAKRDGTEFTVAGSGQARRQFIFSIDLARLMVWALRNYDDPMSPIVLSVDEVDEKSIAQVAQVIAKVMQYDGQPLFDATRPDGQLRKTVSNAKLRSLHPSFHFTMFEDAVTASANWFVTHYDSCRK